MLDYSNEEILYKACCKGIAKAQRHLYDLLFPMANSICNRYVEQNSDAEELISDSFLKLLDSFGKNFKYLGKGSMSAYFKKILVNKALMHLRKSKVTFLPIEEELEFGIEANVVSQMNADAIVKAIQMLPMGYRTVLNLFAIEGYSHVEIGEELGISVGTSKSQLHKAKQTLLKILEDNEK